MKLCSVTLIIEYIKMRNIYWKAIHQEPVFLTTYRKPIRAAHRYTMARWTKNIMKEPGVDNKMFKAQRNRSP